MAIVALVDIPNIFAVGVFTSAHVDQEVGSMGYFRTAILLAAITALFSEANLAIEAGNSVENSKANLADRTASSNLPGPPAGPVFFTHRNYCGKPAG